MHNQKYVKIVSQITGDVIKICHNITTPRAKPRQKEGSKRQKVHEKDQYVLYKHI